MKDLTYHFHVTQPDDLIFEIPPYAHFGDQIAFLNLIRSLNPPGCRINPGTSQEGLEMALLFFDNQALTQLPATCVFYCSAEYLDEVYKNRYHKINSKRDANSTTRDLITYSFDSRHACEAKTPPYLSELLSHLRKLADVVEVGAALGISKTAALIEESRLFVGVDNGVSQLCRCTDTPHILLEHLHDVERAFPRDFHDYFKANSLKSAVELARCTLARG